MQWISVKDIMPPKYENVLITDGDEIQLGHLLEDNEWGSYVKPFYRLDVDNVTHWAWLPPLPVKRYWGYE
jgi:hypothetical protein